MHTHSILRGNVLVLNKSWIPINVTIVKDAINLIFRENASIIAHEDLLDNFNKVISQKYSIINYNDWIEISEFVKEDYGLIRSSRRKHFRPRVVLLNRYAGYPNYYIKLSRNGIYSRDEGLCQYCLNEVSKCEFTIDHVRPKSKGGRTEWDNLVLSCKFCNAKKGDKTLLESSMTLNKKPIKPSSYNFEKIYEKENKYWRSFLKEKK